MKLNYAISFGLALKMLLACALISPDIQADEGGASFWLPGQFGSFAANPAKPGWSLALTYYHSSLSTGAGKNFEIGGKIETGVTAYSNWLFAAPTYTFNDAVLGGQAAISVTGTFGHTSSSADATLVGPGGAVLARNERDSIVGAGDIFPLGSLRWNKGNHNIKTYTMVGVPVGNYQVGHLANLGINHWSIDIGSGYTYYNIQTGREFSIVAGFTHNFENPDTKYRNGNNLHFDWGASQFLSKHWQVGLVGYYYHQITGDSGSGALLGDFRSRIGGIGPQVGYQFKMGKQEYHLNLRGYREFGAKNRPEGWNAWVTLTIPIESRNNRKLQSTSTSLTRYWK